MDRIFDMADEAYNHMQDLDSKTWDERNWSNWTTLFVQGQAISGVLGTLTSGQSTQATILAIDVLDQFALSNYYNF